MNDIRGLIADLRQFMAEEIPAGIAHKALSHAMTELPQGAGSAWLIKRAAYIIRAREEPTHTKDSGVGGHKPCEECDGTGRQAMPHALRDIAAAGATIQCDWCHGDGYIADEEDSHTKDAGADHG